MIKTELTKEAIQLFQVGVGRPLINENKVVSALSERHTKIVDTFYKRFEVTL